MGSQSGDPLEKGGDPAGPRSLGDTGRSMTIGVYPRDLAIWTTGLGMEIKVRLVVDLAIS